MKEGDSSEHTHPELSAVEYTFPDQGALGSVAPPVGLPVWQQGRRPNGLEIFPSLCDLGKCWRCFKGKMIEPDFTDIRDGEGEGSFSLGILSMKGKTLSKWWWPITTVSVALGINKKACRRLILWSLHRGEWIGGWARSCIGSIRGW